MGPSPLSGCPAGSLMMAGADVDASRCTAWVSAAATGAGLASHDVPIKEHVTSGVLTCKEIKIPLVMGASLLISSAFYAAEASRLPDNIQSSQIWSLSVRSTYDGFDKTAILTLQATFQ